MDRDGTGDLFLTPVRAGTGVEYYDDNNPGGGPDQSIDFAADQRVPDVAGSWRFRAIGYVFEMDGGDGFKRYGARPRHPRGPDFLIFDWAFQTDPGNPELMVDARRAALRLPSSDRDGSRPS